MQSTDATAAMLAGLGADLDRDAHQADAKHALLMAPPAGCTSAVRGVAPVVRPDPVSGLSLQEYRVVVLLDAAMRGASSAVMPSTRSLAKSMRLKRSEVEGIIAALKAKGVITAVTVARALETAHECLEDSRSPSIHPAVRRPALLPATPASL